MSALTRWNPIEAMEDFLSEGFKLVPSPQGRQGRFDMWQEGNQLYLQLEAPGFKPNDFNIAIEGDRLHIHAQREERSEKKERNYFCREISSQSFERWIPLPCEVREEAEAQYDDGLLTLTLQQASATPVKQIKVKSGKSR